LKINPLENQSNYLKMKKENDQLESIHQTDEKKIKKKKNENN
jgi:hypothetical protein